MQKAESFKNALGGLVGGAHNCPGGPGCSGWALLFRVCRLFDTFSILISVPSAPRLQDSYLSFADVGMYVDVQCMMSALVSARVCEEHPSRKGLRPFCWVYTEGVAID